MPGKHEVQDTGIMEKFTAVAKPVAKALLLVMAVNGVIGAARYGLAGESALEGAKESAADVVQMINSTEWKVRPYHGDHDTYADDAQSADLSEGVMISRTVSGIHGHEQEIELLVNKNGVAVWASGVADAANGDGRSGQSSSDIEATFGHGEEGAKKVKGFVALANEALGLNIKVTGMQTDRDRTVNLSTSEIQELVRNGDIITSGQAFTRYNDQQFIHVDADDMNVSHPSVRDISETTVSREWFYENTSTEKYEMMLATMVRNAKDLVNDHLEPNPDLPAKKTPSEIKADNNNRSRGVTLRI